MAKPKLNIFSSLTIDNFHAFGTETQFDFAPISILTGTNSSGKSSLTEKSKDLNYQGECDHFFYFTTTKSIFP